ncbi:hypothetical protein DID96_29630 [Burkholderia sp. Bp8963]|uniref:hypothetical protein n=1 Tax=Burkholderia sp. Bp8963 TaxID=2184547 RepID=UPI000F5B464E|nr:hypothetical protein [Burkholderia sp. Bp8963]RQS63558.1 hypothetical protein DID96_29630 [Burkholderia sp. Bp8963]
MELHMHSHHFTRRTPDWRTAVIGGCAAGVVLVVLELLAMWVTGQSPWGPPRMIAAIALGRDALAQPATFDLGIMLLALVVHFALSIVFALILSVIVAPFSFDSSVGMASLVGAVFGAAVYLVNFYGMTRWFPWFAEARGWMSLVGHIVFGLVAADTYLRLERRETDVSGTKTIS